MAASPSDDWRYRIKAATRDLVRRCGGVERAAELCGVAVSTVSRWQTGGGDDDPIIPLMAALRLEADCGEPLVTRAMAAISGRTIVAAEEAERLSSVRRRDGDLMAALGDLLGVYGQSVAVNHFTPSEAERMDRAASAVARVLDDMRREFASVRAAGGLAVGAGSMGERA